MSQEGIYFADLIKAQGFTQERVRYALEKRGIFKNKQTISRWCSRRNTCRDLFVIKALAKILRTGEQTIIDSFNFKPIGNKKLKHKVKNKTVDPTI